jgi:hypothetical protein
MSLKNLGGDTNKEQKRDDIFADGLLLSAVRTQTDNSNQTSEGKTK